MSSPVQTEEDDVEEVEFVSEARLRPVSEYIELLSDSDDEGCSSFTMMHENNVTREKAHVTSTLDRLAREVAQEKKKREDKCRAFKEKQIKQRTHAQQELAFSSANGVDREAKQCVDMWLKMPGVKPGPIGGVFGRRRRSAPFSMSTSTRHTCPVINCGRVFDHASLLDGHLKRFDHSPCDPTIHLKGMPAELFACVVCCLHFQTKEAWKKHLESKVSSSTAGAHSITQIYQRIVAFACPSCYLLFNVKDECLQHMSAKNHFTEALAKNESQRTPLPVPVPQYVKNRLITLCKEVGFNVRCSLCHKVLLSHQAAQAHFNVHCRQGCAVAKADKTIVQVIKQLHVPGQCSTCCKIFLTHAEIEGHKESTQHDVEINLTTEKALLQHCRFSPSQENLRTKQASGEMEYTSHGTPGQKRNRESDGSSTKRQRTSRNLTVAWFCECGLSFPEEATARKHILAINQIFHQCGVCGKHMSESSVARLHMSRFHGGAHLSNFLYYCRKCKVEMPRYEDILLHVSQAHSGHTFFSEQEVPKDVATVVDSKPSTSYDDPQASSSEPSAAGQTWMCRMCEDTFDSEAAVRQHCSDINMHSFQRFICGHCPQKFFKESTVRRHCLNEHPGQIKSFHFCGLCDSMQFDTEGEFLEHYERLHSTEYCCLSDDVAQPAVDERVSQLTCPCMSSKKSKEETRAIYTKCMKKLAAEGKCLYVCAPCGLSVANYAQMKTHVHTKHAALNLDKTFNIECKACPEGFAGVPDFHNHYHSHHCDLEPCVNSRSCQKEIKTETTTGNAHDAVEVKSENNDDSDEEMEHALSMSKEDARESAEMEEALKRSLLEF